MLTKLDIINDMLASTGTAPLTANDTSHPLYIKADNKLTKLNIEFQSKGWWFNRATRTLAQNVSGEVVLPSTTLHADPVDRTSRFVRRGTKLYDPENATYVLDTDVEVKFVELLDVTNLPPSAQAYLNALAVHRFYLDEDGGRLKLAEYKEARSEAWVALKAEELRNADVNFFNGHSAAQMSRGTYSSRLPLTDR